MYVICTLSAVLCIPEGYIKLQEGYKTHTPSPSFPPYLLWCHNTAIAGHGYEVERLCVWEEAKGGSGVRRSPHLHDPAADVVATYHVHIVVEKIGGGEPTDAISK